MEHETHIETKNYITKVIFDAILVQREIHNQSETIPISELGDIKQLSDAIYLMEAKKEYSKDEKKRLIKAIRKACKINAYAMASFVKELL